MLVRFIGPLKTHSEHVRMATSCMFDLSTHNKHFATANTHTSNNIGNNNIWFGVFVATLADQTVYEFNEMRFTFKLPDLFVSRCLLYIKTAQKYLHTIVFVCTMISNSRDASCHETHTPKCTNTYIFCFPVRDWLSMIPPTAALAGLGYMSYLAFCPEGRPKPGNRCNTLIRLNEQKVVDSVDIEDIAEKAAYCRCWKSQNVRLLIVDYHTNASITYSITFPVALLWWCARRSQQGDWRQCRPRRRQAQTKGGRLKQSSRLVRVVTLAVFWYYKCPCYRQPPVGWSDMVHWNGIATSSVIYVEIHTQIALSCGTT